MTQQAPVSRIKPQLSSICPGDFGLKAGFWSRKPGDSIRFSPIVGWVTVMNYAEAGKLPFVSVVIGARHTPKLASPSNFPDFIGVFAKNLTPEQALEQFQKCASDQPTPPPSTTPTTPGSEPLE
ncbi:hypothetical protein K2X85_19075 [bacterium]|nr:hypothetical protein [bacterium]